MTQFLDIQTGSGNIFEDLGLENPDELLVKAELARKISGIVTSQNMTQAEAAELLGIDQPKVSALMNGNIRHLNDTIVSLFKCPWTGCRNCCEAEVFIERSNTSHCLIT